LSHGDQNETIGQVGPSIHGQGAKKINFPFAQGDSGEQGSAILEKGQAPGVALQFSAFADLDLGKREP
jgi:hypothetical protein